MADISKEIEALENAKYGKEVRGALVSLAKKNNEVSESTEESEKRRAAAEKNRVEEEQKRNSAEETRQTNTGAAINRCNTATDRANKAAQAVEDAIEGEGFVTEEEKGKAGGVASLDSAGKVPSEQMADIGKLATFFSQASVRDNLKSGEKLNEILGKIMKWFADLKLHAFETPVQNFTTNVAGKALDAIMGKKLKDEIDKIENSLTDNLNQNRIELTNSSYYPDAICYRSGQIVYMKCSGTLEKEVPANAPYVIGIESMMPEAFRPNVNIVTYPNISLGGKNIKVEILTSGRVIFTSPEKLQVGFGLNMHFTYMTGKSNF